MDDIDLDLGAGVLRVHDTGHRDRLPVLWHHGTPNTGHPPEPLFAAADRLGVRLVGWDRPGYGASTARPGRRVADAADLATAVADALGLDRVAVLGHSGGGPHALACAALLGDRVLAGVTSASLAPLDAPDLDPFDGMAASGVAALSAARHGRDTRARWEEEHGDSYDPEFVDADMETFSGDWAWILQVVEAGNANGPDPAIDDDVAYAARWGFDPATIDAPVLLQHGGRDRVVPVSHGRWLASHIPTATLRTYPDDGHVSVLRHAEEALAWLVMQTAG